MTKKKNKADISLEVAHLYLYGLSDEDFKTEVKNAVAAVQECLCPLIEFWRERQGQNVTTTVLLDDYQTAYKPKTLKTDRSFAIRTVTDELSEVGIEVDFIVFESAVALSAKETMLAMIESKPPKKLKFSEGPARASDEMRHQLYFNFEPFPDSEETDWEYHSRIGQAVDEGKARDLLNSVGTHVNLLYRWDNEKFWSCPALSAWWQLLRLGFLSYEVLQIMQENDGCRVLNESALLTAHSTFTVLPTKYLETEHAARRILETIKFSKEDRKVIGISEEEEQEDKLMHRIRYAFWD